MSERERGKVEPELEVKTGIVLNELGGIET
jgi:hypothetical protein